MRRHAALLRALPRAASSGGSSTAAACNSSRAPSSACRVHARAAHSDSSAPGSPPQPPAQLFGVPYLREPADFQKAASVVVEVCNPLVEAIATQPEGLHTLHKLDTISDSLCKVLDAAECARNVHASEKWRKAADDTFQSLASYMYNLNANVPLYKALARLTNNPEQMAALTEEQRRMGILLRREFERDGIHLSDDARAAVIAMNNEIGGLMGEFMSRVHAPPTPFTVQPAGPALACLPPGLASKLPPRSFADKVAGASGAVTLTTDSLTVEYLLRLCRDAGVREAVLRAAHVDSTGNVPVIHRLVGARARLAQLIGFDSYASLVTSDRMAGEPARVIAFLRTLSKALLPRLALELAELSQAAAAEAEVGSARKAEASAGSATAGGSAGSPASPPMRQLYALITSSMGGHVGLSDLPYLSRAVTAARHWGVKPQAPPAPVPGLRGALSKPVHTTAARDPLSAETAAASEFLPLSAALDGLGLVMRRVFGVSMVRVPMVEGERWDSSSNGGSGDGNSESSGLVKLVLRHDAEGALGTLYLDPFSRPGKFGGAAHFVVRCGKRLHAGDGVFEAAMGVDLSTQVSTVGGTPAGPAQSFQLPIITLVASMAPMTQQLVNSAPLAGASSLSSSSGAGSSSSSSSSTKAASDPLNAVLLTPGELETLFHEFGHALHSLLSRTEFQHLSGTRGALDFVELPSHVFEYWARDTRSVRSFARHYITGAPMPVDLWERVQAARTSFWAHELSSSIANAAFDQALHGDEAGRAAILAGPEVTQEQVAYMAEAAVRAVKAAAAQPGMPRPSLADIVPPGYWQEGGSSGSSRDSSSGSDGSSGSGCGAGPLVIPLAPNDTLRPMPEGPGAGAGTGAGAGAGAALEASSPDSTALYHAVTATYTLPTLPGSSGSGGSSSAGSGGKGFDAPYAWHARFSHLATYGAGYYTYLYATAFASAVWDKLFAADPFSRKAGDEYRRMVLAKGAAADPCAMITQLLGHAPTLEPLLKDLKLRE